MDSLPKAMPKHIKEECFKESVELNNTTTFKTKKTIPLDGIINLSMQQIIEHYKAKI